MSGRLSRFPEVDPDVLYGDRVIFGVAFWQDERAGVAHEVDSAVPVELRVEHVARYLEENLLRNPQSVWCRTRGCGHLALKHRDGVCMVDGCVCDALRED